MLLLAQQVRAYERIAPAEQERLQLAQLRALLEHAYSHSTFWRERLDAAGHRPGLPIEAAFVRLPPLTRADLQGDPVALRARWPGLEDAHVHATVTSGSTGMPVRVERASALFDPLYAAINLVDMEWHGYDPSAPLAILAPGGQQGQRQGWGGAFELLGLHGPCHRWTTENRSLDEILEWLREIGARYLVASALLAAELAHRALERKLVLPLHQILSKSERVTARHRDVCRRAFGATIVDRYSCEESGWIALQCPQNDHLHVLNSNVLLEIVDDEGRPCAPGEVGRVLLTSLHSYAMPLIRYELGDLAEWGTPCPCGMTLPVIKRLWGRVRQQVSLPSGRFMPMPFLGDDLGKIPAIRSFRLFQYADMVVELQLEVAHGLSAAETAEVKKIFPANGMGALEVHIHEVASIAWEPGRKREEFTRVATPWHPAPEVASG